MLADEQAPKCDAPLPHHPDVRCDKRPRHRGWHRVIIVSAGGRYKGRWVAEWRRA